MDLSLNEVAARAGVSFETARRWAHAGLGYQVGGRWRIDPIKLDRKLRGLPLDPTPTPELATLLRQAADAIDGDGRVLAKPLALIVGELTARVRGEEIRGEESAATTKTPDRETANPRNGGAAS